MTTTLVINSRILNETFEFFWTGSRNGYIYLTSERRPGTLGQQICDGGGTMGQTLTASDETEFARTARNWYRAYLRNNR